MIQMRKSTFDDIDAILEIYDGARAALKAQGVDQWQDGYPSTQQVEADIENSVSYVFTDSEGIVGTAMIGLEGDADYDEIDDGAWRKSAPFAVVHRVAVRPQAKGRGVAVDMMAHAEMLAKNEGFHYLRIDTHPDNKSMQRLLAKTGFVRCGIVFVHGARLARNLRWGYDKILS